MGEEGRGGVVKRVFMRDGISLVDVSPVFWNHGRGGRVVVTYVRIEG